MSLNVKSFYLGELISFLLLLHSSGLVTDLPPQLMSVLFQKARISIKIIHLVPVPHDEYPNPD